VRVSPIAITFAALTDLAALAVADPCRIKYNVIKPSSGGLVPYASGDGHFHRGAVHPARAIIAMPGMTSAFGMISTATGDVFACKTEGTKSLIIDFAKPRPYALFGRVVFGLNQSTHEA
jgi:hypothetical protein